MAKNVNINSKNVLIIVLAAVLGAIILLGVVLGTIAIVSEANAAISYGGVRVKRGVAAYLASTYKASYTKEADKLEASTEEYIRRVVAAAYLFDRASSLDDSAKSWIEKNTAEVLDYKAGNSVEEFNRLAEPMGFDYSDFKEATELIYKAAASISAIYGVGGANLSYSDNVSAVTPYFDTYTHVKVVFIRTEDKFVRDENGNRVQDENFNDKTIALTDEEKAEVQADIAEAEELMNNANNGSGVEMSLEVFNSYYETYNDDPANKDGGYYFHESSAFTAEYREEYPNLVSKALSMSVGEWGSSTDGSTVCLIYKYSPILHDYAASSMSHFFGDFYSDAAEYLFIAEVEELAKEVKVKDGYAEIDVSSLKKNSNLKTSLGLGLAW